MHKMIKTEILAPAKDKETAFAAINCGADAVYIGAPFFGARKNASNTLDDIKEVVNYAHKYWSRVHVTLNTILTDDELVDAVMLVKDLSDIGVDALIIQDLGLLEKLIELSEEINLPQIHMSTQCDNYLPEKVKFFNNIGVSRVILAREVSIEKIRQLHNENPNLELENFIHGALCVSFSGQCYLSQYIGGRSANRGECAQPCRKMYDVIDSKGNIIAKDIYPLCLKDFNGSKYIKELKKAGICSFKIEGRLKDINYVKNVVSYYKQFLGKGSSSGKSNYLFEPNPEKSFNRGFTEYFLNDRSNCYSIDSPKSKGEYIGTVVKVGKNHFEIKTKAELHPQDGLYFKDNGCLINKVIKNKSSVTIYPNKHVNLNIDDEIYRNLDVEFEKELEKSVKRQIGISILMLSCLEGDIIQGRKEVCQIKITDEDGVTITAEIPSVEQANNPEKMKETFIKQFSKTGEGDFYIKDIKIASNTELPFMPVSEINQLRRSLFEKLMKKRLEIYEKNRNFQKPMKHAKYYADKVDYRANIYNNSAKIFYEKCGVKVIEFALEKNLPKRQIELMRCKHCIKYALNMCKSPLNISLKDTHGKIYPLKFNCKECEMSVLTPDG